MKGLCKLVGLLSCIIVAMTAQAIVIRHDVDDDEYLAKREDFPPLATFYVDGAHGTLIAPTWIVTAAHATFCITPGSFVTINGQPRKIKQLYINPKYKPGKSHDIALVELVQPVTDVVPANLNSHSDELKQNIWFIGIGGTGNGLTGQTIDNAANNGILRIAQNQVSAVEGPLMKFTFDQGSNALPLEGVSGAGDSGGPAYLKTAQGYQLFGVSSRFEHGAIGEYGITEIYSRISYFHQWLMKIINGDHKSQLQLSSAKLSASQLPAGLSDEILPDVCQHITIKTETVDL